MKLENLGFMPRRVFPHVEISPVGCFPRHCAPMLNALHEQVKSLRCFPWAEWVPAAAIADWASRPDLHWRVPASSSWRTMVLPPLDVFLGDL